MSNPIKVDDLTGWLAVKAAIEATEGWPRLVERLAGSQDALFWLNFNRPVDRDVARAAVDEAWEQGAIKSWRDVAIVFMALESLGAGARALGVEGAGVRMYDHDGP